MIKKNIKKRYVNKKKSGLTEKTQKIKVENRDWDFNFNFSTFMCEISIYYYHIVYLKKSTNNNLSGIISNNFFRNFGLFLFLVKEGSHPKSKKN